MYGLDLYGLVRRAVMLEGLSQRAAARRFGIDRGTVAKMISSGTPPGYPPRAESGGAATIFDLRGGASKRGQRSASICPSLHLTCI